jgi:acyl-CoA thioesterase-2
VQDSPNSIGGRGLSFGRIYDQAGHLLASVAQEGMIRLPVPED